MRDGAKERKSVRKRTRSCATARRNVNLSGNALAHARQYGGTKIWGRKRIRSCPTARRNVHLRRENTLARSLSGFARWATTSGSAKGRTQQIRRSRIPRSVSGFARHRRRAARRSRTQQIRRSRIPSTQRARQAPYFSPTTKRLANIARACSFAFTTLCRSGMP